MTRALVALGAMVIAGCGGGVADVDAGAEPDAGSVPHDAGAPRDAGRDGAVHDAGPDAAQPEDAGREDAGTADSGPEDAGPEDAGLEDAGLEDAGPEDAGTDAAMPVDAGPPRIELTDLEVYANCAPIVPLDPIIVRWTVTITGAPASSATLTSAHLEITNGTDTVAQNLTVDMPTIPLSGGAGSGMQRKVGADANAPLVCALLCAGANFTLRLDYDVGGTTINVMESGAFACLH
ncbi:MAG TPA: hypothetical protein VIL20_19140 [Sandaracinaceae bacterium]